MAKNFTVTVEVDAAAGLAKFEQVRAAFSPEKMTGMSTGDAIRLHFAVKPDVADLLAIRLLFDNANAVLDSDEVEDDPDVHQKGLVAGTLKGFWDDTVRYVLDQGVHQNGGVYRNEKGDVLVVAPGAVLLNDLEPLLKLLTTNYDELEDELKNAIKQVVTELMTITDKIKGAKKK